MKLNRLLQEHRRFSAPTAVSGNFGDGYLVQNNRVYGRLRAALIGLGYRLSDERNDAYAALPLSQLEAVLAAKTLPYIDNVAVLEALEARRPGLIEWDDVRENYKRNLLFHETCHAVARAEATALLGPAGPPTDGTERQHLVFRMLLEESFANTCELLACVDAADATHRIFYEANSYTSLFEERTNLKNALAEIGEETVWMFLLFSYLAANFLRPALDERSFERAVRLSGADPKALDAKKLKTLRALAKIAFRLDEGFRTTTTGFYFRMNGLQNRMDELLGFDFLETADTPGPRRLIAELMKVVLRN